MFHKGSVATNARLNQFAIVRMRPDCSGQAEKRERLFQIHVVRTPPLRQAGAGWFFHLFGHFSALHVRAKPARAQEDLIPVVFAKCAIATLFLPANGPRVAAFRVV